MKQLHLRHRVKTSHGASTSGTSPSSHSSIVTAVEHGGSYSNTRRLWSAVYDKVFECTDHNAERNSWSAVPGQQISCRSSPGRCLIIIHPIARTSRPVISIFLTFQEIPVRPVSAFPEWQRGGDECHSGSNPSPEFYDTRYNSWSHGMKISQIRRWICWKIAQHLLYLFQ